LRIAVGLVLALAVDTELAGVDVQTIGRILAIVGLIGLVITAFIWGPRRRAADEVVEQRHVGDDGV
jgi:hypothetical protein